MKVRKFLLTAVAAIASIAMAACPGTNRTEDPAYRIELAGVQGGQHTFPELYFGYAAGEITALSVTVRNTGNRATGPLAVALSGTNYDSFGLSIPPASQSPELALDDIGVGGAATFTVAPRLALEVGTYTATVTVSGESGSAITAQSFTVTFEVSPQPMRGIRLSATNAFQIRVLGYAANDVRPLVVTVNSAGTHPTGELAMALSGANAGDFTLSAATLPSIQSGGNDTFTVLPVQDLGLGVYTATVTVSGADIASRYLDFTFEVVADADITADFVHPSFLARVRTITGRAAPDPIYLSDVMDITSVTLTGATTPTDFIDNFAGLRHFRSLEILRIGHHGAVATSPNTPAEGRGGIDISVLPNLREFHSDGRGQTQASMRLRWIIVGNPLLEHMEIYLPNASFTSLDITGAPSLRRLALMNVPTLETLDLSQNPLLEELNLDVSNSLRVVDTSHNPNLIHLQITGGGTGRNLELNLTNNVNLESLWIIGAGLTGFDWPTLVKLDDLNLSGNALTSVNLRPLQALDRVWVEQNNLTTLDLSDMPYLRVVNAQMNAISNVVLRGNTGLTTGLNLASNGAGRTGMDFGTFSNADFESIDFAQAPNLEFLNLNRNSLTGLDLARLGNIQQLLVVENRITDPDDMIGWRERGFMIGAPPEVLPRIEFYPQRIDNPVPPELILDGFTRLPTGVVVLPTGTVGQVYGSDPLPWPVNGLNYGLIVEATGTPGTIWWFTGGQYPPITINAFPMAIVGPPTAAGTFNFTLDVHNQAGSVNAMFVLTLIPPGYSQEPTSVRITPEGAGHYDHVGTMSVSPGTSVALYGIVWDQIDPPAPIPGLGITWAVTGAVSSGTGIDSDGVLTVASDETAATITVTATHGVVTGTTTVTVE